jgi:aquaporin Z
MNPARSFGPDLALGNFANYWIYVSGPLVGAAAAVSIAGVLRGPGDARTAAQGLLGMKRLRSHGTR